MISEAQIQEALRGVIDPDVGVNIVDLGLVERVDAAPEGVYVDLIMTTPACPQSAYIRDEAERRIKAAGAAAVSVEVLDSPFWEPSRMSASAKKIMGWPG
ncbi:metal-sulfur cluster biosynthetic protein [Paramagnetospirillum marisnigri]|uniref:Metal-sulfur cluster biosynthetic protein n=1 Tax=Paramagnetospirillum marisnigri TaxID=1285242 RepID=A0A178MVQ4_9PROT|nr:metal-sulfur cluster assembly factor [Paramagnetospirillum marisnigri]OAN54074.1 metal-sulfur cluster biosynthetic protein [Paramagnetospirillum marisnigri]